MMRSTNHDTFREVRNERFICSDPRIDNSPELGGNHISPHIHETRKLRIDLQYGTMVTISIVRPHQRICG